MKTENKNEFADNNFRHNFDLTNYEKFAIKGFRDVRAINDAAPGDKFLGVHMANNSLKHIGILAGDLLIVRLEADLSKVGKNALCVCDDGRGRNTLFANQIFDEQLFGVVVRIERDL